ncbi:MAG: fluoride efflux transporter CrcB [Chloroflexota bacterium]
MQWTSLWWVGLGGFLGANARYILSTWVAHRMTTIFGRTIPMGTAFVNITGSFLLALFIFYIQERFAVSDQLKWLIGTGFFGAYTTFSTYANESFVLLQGDDWLSGWLYIIGSNVLCLLGVLFAWWIATHIS